MTESFHLSSSAISSKCMEQFRRRFIEHDIKPPGIALVVGIGTHDSIRVNMRRKFETGELADVMEISDIARDSVNREWDKKGVLLQPDEVALGVKVVRGEAVDKAIRLARLHHRKAAPVIKPNFIERPWVLEVSGAPFEIWGRTDIEEDGVVRDAKTSGKTPEKDVAQKSVQMKLYALARKVIDGALPKSMVLDFLIDKKEPEYKPFAHTPDDADIRAVLNRIEVISEAMIKGIFVPVEPGHWCCSPKWCGYYDDCRYIRHPEQFVVNALPPDMVPASEYEE